MKTPPEILLIEDSPHDTKPASRAGKKRHRAKKPIPVEDGQAPPSEPAASPPVEEEAGPEAAGALPETPPQHGFPIVGIGASAGGLAAFEAFFSDMPADTDPGMAFVLVQHLAPDHKSILTDLIRRYTRTQVSEVEDGMVVSRTAPTSSRRPATWRF